MSAGPFEAYEPAALRVPNRGPTGQLFAREAGKMRDEELALLRVALLSRLPSKCPDDALDKVGENVRIPRVAGQSDDSYRAALEAAWPTHETEGGAVAVETQIQAFGIPDVRVYTDDEGAFGPGVPGGWYSRFWVVLGPGFGDTGIGLMALGSWTLGSGTLGSTATRAQIVALKRIVLKWKATHGYPVRIILIFRGGPVLGVGYGDPSSFALTRPLTLGAFTLGGARTISWPIGRTLNDTIPTLGFTLGGYII